ncbi:hypothetical protein [Xanthomonas pisi]|uniref:Lipoprotein n=1 Tax=Xanthomonas pisi TaxID=56457 RepID=A0A2S7CQR2_9XANT|nr:hypothetical protein [Xanthomonas pisi]PPU63882.1 hypothetical protein XpiCFBP4643_22845 [Xanthomonas pisi]
MRILRRIPFLFLAVLLLTGCQPRKTGLFSSLDMDKHGMLHGYEIFIVKGGRSAGADLDYYAIVQCADGKVSPPLIGQVVVTSDQVTITLQEQGQPRCPSTTFTGTIGFNELTGRFGDGKELTLPRKDSFWE